MIRSGSNRLTSAFALSYTVDSEMTFDGQLDLVKGAIIRLELKNFAWIRRFPTNRCSSWIGSGLFFGAHGWACWTRKGI